MRAERRRVYRPRDPARRRPAVVAAEAKQSRVDRPHERLERFANACDDG